MGQTTKKTITEEARTKCWDRKETNDGGDVGTVNRMNKEEKEATGDGINDEEVSASTNNNDTNKEKLVTMILL